MGYGTSRASMLARMGRDVVLSRGAASATVRAFAAPAKPGELDGGLQTGDMRLETGPLPAPFAPPIRGDRVQVDGRSWSVIGAAPIFEGAALIGYSVRMRGA